MIEIVEDRLRREAQVHRTLATRRALAGDDAGRRGEGLGGRRQQFGELAVLLGRIVGRGLQQFGDAELIVVASALAARRRHLADLRRRVVHHLGEFGAGLAVDAAVMGLEVKSGLPVLQPLDDIHLPQGAAAIEQRGVQTGDELLELRHRPGTPQGQRSNMVVEIDVIVLDPHGLRQFERHRREFAGEDRRQMQAVADHRLDVFVEVALIPLGKVEQQQAADMHGRFGRFEMQE